MNVYNNYMVVSLNGRTFTAATSARMTRSRLFPRPARRVASSTATWLPLSARTTATSPSATPPSSPAALLRSPRPRSSRSAAARVPSMSVDVSPSRPCSDSSLPLPVVFVVTPPSSPRSKSTPLVSPARTGHPARPGLTYGMTISLKNVYQEFMQSDANGWVYLRASNGAWDHFDILSPLHREGPVSYGDQVLLRAHNTKLVSVRPGGGIVHNDA